MKMGAPVARVITGKPFLVAEATIKDKITKEVTGKMSVAAVDRCVVGAKGNEMINVSLSGRGQVSARGTKSE